MKDERFLKLHSEGSTLGYQRSIWVDRETGVNYIFMYAGYAGGLTPLLGADGKPVVTPLSAIRREED